MKYLIKVKKEHIKKGKLGTICSCPIALAIEDALFTNVQIYFQKGRACFPFTGTPFSFNLPSRVKRFVARFDKRRSVRPFNFYLASDS